MPMRIFRLCYVSVSKLLSIYVALCATLLHVVNSSALTPLGQYYQNCYGFAVGESGGEDMGLNLIVCMNTNMYHNIKTQINTHQGTYTSARRYTKHDVM